jgi:glutaredoxin
MTQAATQRRPVIAMIAVVLLTSTTWQAWQAWRREALATALVQLAQPGDIRMIGSETCVFCAAARQWLNSAKVPFTECLIERDAQCAADYRAHGGPGTPLMLVRGQPLLGFNPEQVRDALRNAGATRPG